MLVRFVGYEGSLATGWNPVEAFTMEEVADENAAIALAQDFLEDSTPNITRFDAYYTNDSEDKPLLGEIVSFTREAPADQGDQAPAAASSSRDQASEQDGFIILAPADPAELKDAHDEESRYLEQKEEAIKYRHDMPPVPSIVAWLWRRRRIQAALARIEADKHNERELEPFTAF